METKKQEEFREQLLAKMGGVTFSSALEGILPTDDSDAIDHAVGMMNQYVALTEINLRTSQKALCLHALRKMKAGRYGTCDGCGEDIPGKRLRAVPEARYCLECQEESENRGREAAAPRQESWKWANDATD